MAALAVEDRPGVSRRTARAIRSIKGRQDQQQDGGQDAILELWKSVATRSSGPTCILLEDVAPRRSFLNAKRCHKEPNGNTENGYSTFAVFKIR